MSTARERVRRIKAKGKKRKPFLTTKTRTAQVKQGKHKGEWRKTKTTRVRIGKSGNLYRKWTTKKVGEAKRGDVIKSTMSSFTPPNKPGKHKVTKYRQGLERVVKSTRKVGIKDGKTYNVVKTKVIKKKKRKKY